ncbi:NnrS family protein [Marinobacterium arenosum]|uniref:NnrS family protein n=1 Tax=Marinobacterium arenosum TaxID=2862496 RepID=UPI001C942CD1|nr:NnrS family protein [Marinobacterium arenosum]MBY4678596.1 NnrS family protein [Marinobacterium arenosum]
MLQLQEPRKSGPIALFNLGFRPFFLLGALFALLLIGHWLPAFQSGWTPAHYQLGLYWHGHEMLFGFAFAIIAGFLLTAVRTWTQVQTPFGWTLGGLVALWLAARLLPFIPGTPALLLVVIDLAFAPLVALGIGIPIVRSGNYRNLMFLPMMLGFFVANLLVHLQLLGITENSLMSGLYLALYLSIAVITVIGGRVIPFFTERGLGGDTQCTRYPWLEKSILPLTFLWLLAQFWPGGYIAMALSALLGVANLVRLAGWWQPKLWRYPLVWILHAGYLFVGLGCLLQVAAFFELASHSIAVHAFTVGAIGGLTLGMMARVSLGHTGRPLTVTRLIQLAFVLMMLSALSRISVGLLPLEQMQLLHISGGFWMLAWLLFLLRYLPILLKPRVDGLWG